ncbi:uncharacterized protein MKK02DRAFT_43023 [Dioszegia hungarica]|uniref:Uncharacterized protein n=1 Tax=Dioszegia hungarica TaxID=4972 RepID=A0AA38LWQ5_9TREE|nr:uncharacterized protein MKK02DRAFT_43023 [Dioszegia hungarica]KAI9638625.1 hypothetical protein MKK02DRAFT_43023 [Dioszegia hungarica]
MRSSLIRRATHAYQPMIKFVGSRKNIEHPPHAPAPHPAAPQSVKDDFQSFLAKLQSQSSGLSASSNPKGQSLSSSAQGHVRSEDSSSGDSSRPSAGNHSGPAGSSAAGYGGVGEGMGGDGQGEKTVSRGGGGASLSGVGGGQGQKNVEKTSGPMASKPADYDNFWEAPGYLWKIPEVSDRESEAVMSGGATDIRRRF